MNITKKGDKYQGTAIVWCRYSPLVSNTISSSFVKGMSPIDLLLMNMIPDKGGIVASYISHDITRFIEKTGIPLDNLESLLRPSDGQILKQVVQDDQRPMKAYITIIPIESETDLEICGEDIVSTGEYNNKLRCVTSIQLGVSYYLLKMDNQMEEDMGIKLSDRNDLVFDVTVKDLKPDEIVRYLQNHFIIPLLDAQRSEKMEEFDRIANNLISFSKESHFASDSVDIISTMRTHGYNPKNQILDAILRKIGCVVTAKYEKASVIRDEISLMMNEEV